jgi:4-oxalocrotonate tautomerase
MPLINVKVIKDVFYARPSTADRSPAHRRDGGDRGREHAPVTWCIVEEVASGDRAIADNPLHTADVKALAAGTHAN